MKKILLLAFIAIAFFTLTGCEADDFGHHRHLHFSSLNVTTASIVETDYNKIVGSVGDARDLGPVDQKLQSLWAEVIVHSDPSITHKDNVTIVIYPKAEGPTSSRASQAKIDHFKKLDISDHNLLDDKEYLYFRIDLGGPAVTKDEVYVIDVKLHNDDDKKASKNFDIKITNTSAITLP